MSSLRVSTSTVVAREKSKVSHNFPNTNKQALDQPSLGKAEETRYQRLTGCTLHKCITADIIETVSHIFF